MTPTPNSEPQDGPATVFIADPAVVSLYNHDDYYFDIVLVAGWPLLTKSEELSSYQEFLHIVQSCFDPEDYEGTRPAVYFYQPQYLHVTIATLYPLETKKPNDSELIKSYFTKLLKKAALREDWPSNPLQLHIDSTQLGAKAGILLWKELTGGLAKMRKTLEVIVAEEEQKVAGIRWKIHSIPGIVHTTFLRFSSEPKSCGDSVQRQYQSKVVTVIEHIFPMVISVPQVYLVCETTPFMHIPNDEDHVLWSANLAQ